MSGQLYYEDVEVGTEVPTLVKNPSTRQLVKWAGATDDYNEIHYDQEFTRGAGLPGISVHGRLKVAFLSQMITDWLGELGTVRKFSVRFREMDFPNHQMTCRGKVTNKYCQDGEHWVECEVWTENPEEQRTTVGIFTFTLPSRS